ncbi:lipocalin family protein [Stella sp.]|uniref:lipocalin family protein n=1 Tax=Stella sp. TaxID=2912054 RepID=UPI0035B4A0BD
MWRAAVAGWAMVGLAACAGGGRQMPVVERVDLGRYAGEWHEIATIPAWFQRDCASDTRALYRPLAGDRIAVVNRCREADGRLREATGTARTTGAPGEGRLEVTFVSVLGLPVWLAGGAYWIVALDPDYRWSVVGHPSRDYAWILSRTPTLPPETVRQFRARLADLGYDTCRLVVTSDPARPRLCDL